MNLKVERKGKKVLLVESDLHEYMSKKLQELGSLATNVVTALIMVTMIVILNYAKARDVFYYALILLPIAGRFYIGNMVIKWLEKQFKELLKV